MSRSIEDQNGILNDVEVLTIYAIAHVVTCFPFPVFIEGDQCPMHCCHIQQDLSLELEECQTALVTDWKPIGNLGIPVAKVTSDQLLLRNDHQLERIN